MIVNAIHMINVVVGHLFSFGKGYYEHNVHKPLIKEYSIFLFSCLNFTHFIHYIYIYINRKKLIFYFISIYILLFS